MSSVPPVPQNRSRLRNFLRPFFENRFAFISLWIVIFGAVALILFGVATHILVTRIVELQGQALLTSEGQVIRRHERLLKDLRETEDSRSLLARVRLPTANLAELVQHLEATAGKVGVEQIVQAIPEEEDKFGQQYAVPVIRYNLTLAGPLDAIVAYLEALDTIPQLVRVEYVMVKSSDIQDVRTEGIAHIRIAVAVRE